MVTDVFEEAWRENAEPLLQVHWRVFDLLKKIWQRLRYYLLRNWSSLDFWPFLLLKKICNLRLNQEALDHIARLSSKKKYPSLHYMTESDKQCLCCNLGVVEPGYRSVWDCNQDTGSDSETLYLLIPSCCVIRTTHLPLIFFMKTVFKKKRKKK